jgi:hypothetical protein
VVGLQDLLAQLLLPLVDVGVQLVAVLADRELLVVVDWDVDSTGAVRLVVRVVELGHVGMSQSLVSGQTSAWVELEKVAKQVKGVV